MHWIDLETRLTARLKRPLPGRASHRPYTQELGFGRHQGPPSLDVRHAAVMTLLYPRAGQWHLPLLLRPRSMPAHGGQVAFPGGAIESGESLEACSAREAFEELGIEPSSVRFAGRLTPLFVFASNYLVTACVAFADSPPEFRPDAREVDRLLELPLERLSDPASQTRHVIRRQGIDFAAPALTFDGLRIWGATRMMLAELADLVSESMAAGSMNQASPNVAP